MQSELKFLKSQINPHFLFNTLNSLYALTLKKSDAAPEIVIKLSEMMRYMLYECNERRVPLRKEVQYIQNYLDLEQLRQGQNARIEFELNGSIREQQIAPLMFTPFLENSFKHGLNNQLTEGFVRIRLDVEDHKVFLEIENSKAPVKPAQNHNKPSGGIGLVNVRRRLNLIYPDSYNLLVTDQPDKYKVNLDLNLDN
jgi:LytS/YehU family sensor histidine kinase